MADERQRLLSKPMAVAAAPLVAANVPDVTVFDRVECSMITNSKISVVHGENGSFDSGCRVMGVLVLA